MGKFVVKTVKTGFMFNLKAGNGEIIATSEVYTSEAACMSGIESVRKNAPIANLEDQTVAAPAAATALCWRGRWRRSIPPSCCPATTGRAA